MRGQLLRHGGEGRPAPGGEVRGEGGRGRRARLVGERLAADVGDVLAGQPLAAGKLDELRQLMRQAVQSGSAHAANVSGEPVYGQAGVVQAGAHAYLSWFVGYRGTMAVAVIETGATQAQAAAALAGAFLSHIS